MKILELEIHNIRGICELYLQPQGNNLVIWGPNGSGKSAVVDAIDFLLTGRISRLTGKGTGDISLDDHGTHIDHKPEDTLVRALVKIPNVEKPIEIKRCIANPGNLECSEDAVKKNIVPILLLAKRGQHILTRRDILRYITAEPSTRAQEIQELLDIYEIEEIRKALVRVENNSENSLNGAKSAVTLAQGAVNATIEEKTFQVEAILQVINKNRSVLGSKPISELNSNKLKEGVTAPALIPKDKVINTTLLKQDIDNIIEIKSDENVENIAKVDKELRSTITLIKSDPALVKSLKSLQLIRLGIDLLDDAGACPLCDTSWSPNKLKEYLQQRLVQGKTAQQHQDNIDKLSGSLMNQISSTFEKIKKVIYAAEILGLKEEGSRLELWLNNLGKLVEALSNPIERYPDPSFTQDQVRRLLFSPEIEKDCKNILCNAESKYPKTTPEQDAWDTLTRLVENLSAFEKATAFYEYTKLIFKRAALLRTHFISARDTILKRLYNDVRDRFVNLYLSLHGTDENQFKAEIQPDEAGLDLRVDFHGRGNHPPHALHSEGHQDSMGICLYLALAERLTKGIIDLIILDDVVMSVDAGHRRQVCNLLATSFPSNQFLITTHDRTWANQLQTEGIVNSKGMVEFFNWHIETGPQVSYEVEIWKRIDDDITKNDVSNAAARLRHGAEQFLAMACDSLQAPVIYKINGQYELGNLLPAAMGQYRKLLKQAKSSAQSWGKQEAFDTLQEADDIAGSIYKRTNAEQWAVNTNVHYNSWTNSSKTDFQPVVEAFQDLFGLFLCSKCGSMLHLVTSNMVPEAIRCKCNYVNWNLVENKKR